MNATSHAIAAPSMAHVVSFRELFESSVADVWRTLRFLGVRECDLPDICQEVFLVVHKRLGDFEGRSTLRTWVYGICVKVAAAHRRRAYTRREAMHSTPPEQEEPATQDGRIETREQCELLVQVLDGLSDEERAAFVLFEIEERPMTEVAELLGCPLRTAYAKLYAARDEVRGAWKRVSTEGKES